MTRGDRLSTLPPPGEENTDPDADQRAGHVRDQVARVRDARQRNLDDPDCERQHQAGGRS